MVMPRMHSLRDAKPKLLFVTDLYYEARQRDYAAEDLYVSSVLREAFHLILCHPKDTEPFEAVVDAVLFRNTGPVIYYQTEYEAFRKRLLARETAVYNSLDGRADMRGKQYLVELTRQGFPVIPTVEAAEEVDRLPRVETYIVKPRIGADSIGMRSIGSGEIETIDFREVLLQPRVDIRYEVSFYFVDDRMQYALYAPDNAKRWKLEPYEPSPEDLRFARGFIEWNAMKHGIQRVDACRTRDGELLLVELEDLNPYLSLLDLEENVRQRFLDSFRRSLACALGR